MRPNSISLHGYIGEEVGAVRGNVFGLINTIMRIHELTLPPTRQDAGVILRKAGYQPLGKGSFATVWIKPGEPFALKLFSNQDEGYKAFIRLVQANPNPHFPVIRGRLIKITDRYSAIRIELLAPPSTRFWRLIRKCSNYLGSLELIDQGIDVQGNSQEVKLFRFNNHSLSAAIDLIYEQIVRGNPNMMNDIDIRNCRVRGNTLVFIDPLAWGGAQFFGEQAERLDELFTTPLPVKQIEPNRYEFRTGENIFDVEFNEKYDETEVTFKRMDAADPMDPFATQGDFGRPPVAVYTTVLFLMRQYLEKEKPDKLTFYGADDRQALLYHKMIPWLRSVMPKNYNIEFVKGTGLYPDWIEFNRNYHYVGEVAPTQDEETNIAQNKQSKKNQMSVRHLFYVDAPGNTSTYPAL